MILKHLKLVFPVCIPAVFMVSICLADFSANEPTGRYCGFVYHAGYIVRSQVMLGKTEDGRIIGKMVFRDGDDVTEGTVEEPVKSKGRERTVEWKDKYGSGLAIWKFDEKFEQFEGHWGTGMQLPQYMWTGKRCNDFTS